MQITVDINGILRNIPSTNVYEPIVEAIINGIEAIEEKENLNNGEIKVIFERDKTQNTLEGIGENDFTKVEISDNGIGLNKKNFDSFLIVYSPKKHETGGKGFGRFTYIKTFEKVSVESIYKKEEGGEEKVSFDFFTEKKDITENIKREDCEGEETGTKIVLDKINKKDFQKNIDIIAGYILERILTCFISNKKLPKIIVEEKDGRSINLNELYKNNKKVYLEHNEEINLKSEKGEKEKFEIKIFKIFSPDNQQSKVVLTAHYREVVSETIATYITEFQEKFEMKDSKSGNKQIQRNYIIRAYVFGKYLNDNVSLERRTFEFIKKETINLFDKYPFSKDEIMKKVIEIIRKKYNEEVNSRREKKKKKIENYLGKHLYYKGYENKIDWDILPMNPSDDEMDGALYNVKYSEEKNAREKVNSFLKDIDSNIDEKISAEFSRLTQANFSNLGRYISMRKIYLEVLKKTLNMKDGKHKKEKDLHNIIFPMGKSSDDVPFHEHNLWILDERLNFVHYLTSDKNFVEQCRDRVDLIVYDKEVIFRGSDNPSNPITIFEFKRPGEDKFTDQVEKNPFDQIIRYVENIKNGTIRSPENRPITVDKGTPFYGYIIADDTKKIREWLQRKEFKPLPSGQKWRRWHEGYNLYVEYITWDQLLNDARERNEIFFQQLSKS